MRRRTQKPAGTLGAAIGEITNHPSRFGASTAILLLPSLLLGWLPSPAVAIGDPGCADHEEAVINGAIAEALTSPLDETDPAATAASPMPVALRERPVLPVAGDNSRSRGIDWAGLVQSSSRFVALEHGFRLLTEPGTRSGLKGRLLANYANAVSSLHGWADGDEFYVNYVGHPMQGSVAAFLWTHNDRSYRDVHFSRNPLYWKGRLRAAAFAWAYSTQFEIGPLSEASLGGIQSVYPQQGLVDHIITPSLGMAWMIGEDSIDRYLIRRVEARTSNRWVRRLVRSGLNPARSLANFLGGHAPWYRETALAGASALQRRSVASLERSPPLSGLFPEKGLAAPFEFAANFRTERLRGSASALSCFGGGATAAFRLAPSWQLVADIGGCNINGLSADLSGDALTYLVGPRWLGRIAGPWRAHLQALAGGRKQTAERMYPERRNLVEAAALRDGGAPPEHSDYTDHAGSHGFALAVGGGVDFAVNRALTIQVAQFDYQYNSTAAIWGQGITNSTKLTSGLVLRMGTW
jgi:hypothetical protein